MKDYFAKHKDARPFQKRPLPLQEELYFLFQGKTATGKRAGGIASVIAAADVQDPITVEDSSATIDDSKTQSDSRKRASETPSSGRRLQKVNKKEVDELTLEIRRGNDLLQAKFERQAPIESAIAMFDDKYATELAMAKQLMVLKALQEGSNAVVFLKSDEARQRALMDLWLE